MAGSDSSTKQLQRRLRGLGTKQWTMNTHWGITNHIAAKRSLACLDELSDCVSTATGHIVNITSVGPDDNQRQLIALLKDFMPPMQATVLCVELRPAAARGWAGAVRQQQQRLA
jgi:hypothetical protein